MGVAVRTGCFFKDHIGASAYRNETADQRLRRRRSGMRHKNIVESTTERHGTGEEIAYLASSKKLTGISITGGEKAKTNVFSEPEVQEMEM